MTSLMAQWQILSIKTSRTWKHDLIRRLYQPHTCKEILQLPLSRTSSLEDKLLWRHSNSREYKVNKAYSMLQEIHHPSMLQEGRNHGLPQSVRKLIWKVNLPYKIRDKVLHLSHNYLFSCFWLP